MKLRLTLTLFSALVSLPLLNAGLSDAITYCDPLECLVPDYCTPPLGEQECELLSQVSCESRRLYNSLDCLGKNRALELSQCYCDLDEAVEQAAKEMGLRQWRQYPNQIEYDEEIEIQTGQSAYNRRFGY